MVGGVSPGKAGSMHLGLPVFGSVQEVRWNSLLANVFLSEIPNSVGIDVVGMLTCAGMVYRLWTRSNQMLR